MTAKNQVSAVAILALVAAALLLRVGYFVEVARGPLVDQHLWTETDMQFFDQVARRIAGGDLLLDVELHPHHRLQEAIAASYLRSHPDAAAELRSRIPAGDSSTKAWHLLWNRWYGGKRFHQAPLYYYGVALVYALFGPDARWVFALQMLLGTASVLLAYRVARKCFGETVGLTAGWIAVLCGPLLYHEMLLLRATALVFGTLLLVYLALRALEHGTPARWLAFGVGSGLALLLKTSFAPFCLVVLVAGLVAAGSSSQKLTRIGAALGGIVLCLAPAMARNVATGVGPLQLSSVGGATFVFTNSVESRPGEGYVTDASAAAILGKTEGRFLSSVIETFQSQPSLADYAGRLARKLGETWHWYEIPNNANFYYYRLHSKILRFLPVTFLLVGPLGLVGLALAARRVSTCWPLYVMLALALVVLMGFGVMSRLRLPLVATLLPFAALTLVELVQSVRARHIRRAVAILVGIVVLGAWVGRPLSAARERIRVADYRVPYLVHYEPAARAAQARGDWEESARLHAAALWHEPEAVRRLGITTPAPSRREADLARHFALVRYRYAETLRRVGREKEAAATIRRVGELRQAAEGR